MFHRLLNNIKSDLPASIVVFFVAIPLCLGIALASGAPLFSGLIAGIIGGVVVGVISDSNFGVSGPAAGLAVVVLTAINDLGSFEAFLLAVMIAGVIQIIMGFVKGGIIGLYFPSAVIKGMLAGIGIMIFFKQLPLAFGVSAIELNTFSLEAISIGSVIISCLSLLILYGYDKYLKDNGGLFKIIPASLIAVSIAVVYNLLSSAYFSNLAIDNSDLVNIPTSQNLSSFLSNFVLPDFSRITELSIWLTGITIAIIASLETLLCVEATDRMKPGAKSTSTNRELIAQGAGNFASGLIGGLPITQVIVRSSANIQSGAKTKMSTIIHGFLILLSIAFIPFVLNLIPIAALAAILLMVGYKLAPPSLFVSMFNLGWKHFLTFLITVFGVVGAGLLSGVFLGMAFAIITSIPMSFYKCINIVEDKSDNRKKINIIFSEKITFLNKMTILKALKSIDSESDVVIDMRKSKHIDYDIIDIIERFKIKSLEKNRNTLILEQ